MQEIELKEFITQQNTVRGSCGEFLLKATAIIPVWSSD